LANDGKENGRNWIEKVKPHQKNTSKLKKKKSELLLLLLLLLLYTFPFNDLKASKHQIKEKLKTKKKTGVRIRPSLAGYRLGTRIRATLARILILGPATDPHLRICGPGACLKARTTGLLRTVFGLLTDSF
jgi:hypothetical protein